LSPDFVAFKSQYSNVVGYFGAIAPWLWYEAIAELVERRKDVGFVFIGPSYTGGLDQLPISENLLYLGVVEYNVLPAYGRQFDVCIIPFAPGEIARTTSPLKLFEYFALEKPVVVTSEMVECVAFKEVFSGDSVNAISQAIDKALTVKADPELKTRLAQLADENSWDERVRNMEQLFTRLTSPRV
jgi:glycosyltransferase involved in cell wall biosynthesis